MLTFHYDSVQDFIRGLNNVADPYMLAFLLRDENWSALITLWIMDNSIKEDTSFSAKFASYVREVLEARMKYCRENPIPPEYVNEYSRQIKF